MWGNMMGWDGWGGGPAMFGPGRLVWWGLIVVAIVLLVRWLTNTGRARSGAGEDRALAILRERYARGEIDKSEFEARKRDLA
jgi:putative membrane protein